MAQVNPSICRSTCRVSKRFHYGLLRVNAPAFECSLV
jgi:hypothetical protein